MKTQHFVTTVRKLSQPDAFGNGHGAKGDTVTDVWMSPTWCKNCRSGTPADGSETTRRNEGRAGENNRYVAEDSSAMGTQQFGK